MAYRVLARKYRPQRFEDVYAQEHITRTLSNAINLNRIAHAYLFTGPRGVGKTSMARIFSKSLNCVHGPTPEPCNVCDNCVEITAGTSSDVIEIDGASNTSVEDVRDLQRELMYATSKSKYKIYIIDEVHMLSKSAFNALLKTLEEPPENVIFIFATTEPHKILPTIISRCQRYDCRRIPVEDIVKQMQSIADSEEISFDEDALYTVARKADGSMRDALSLMDQVISYGSQEITGELVQSIFGILPAETYIEMLDHVQKRDSTGLLVKLRQILDSGNDLQEFLNGYLDTLRNLLLLKVGVDLHELPASIINELKLRSQQFTENDLLYMISLLIKAKTDARFGSDPVLLTEMVFIKLTRISEIQSLDTMIEMLNKQPVESRQETEAFSGIQKEILHYTRDRETEKIVQEVKKQKPEVENLDLAYVQGRWEDFIKKLQREKLQLSAIYLQEGKILTVRDNLIEVELKSPTAMSSMQRNLEDIQACAQKHFGIKPRFKFTVCEPEQEQYILNPTLEQIREETPELAEFIEMTKSKVESRTPTKLNQ